MEIGSTDFEDPVVYSNYDPDFDEWKKVGQVALASFSFVAFSAFIPAFFKKKRAITPMMSNSPILPPEPAAEPVAEPGERPAVLRAPRCTDIERPKVEEIFRTSARGAASLALSAFRLMQLGDEIDHIHPFSFLLAAPREHVRTIFHTGSNFIIGRVMGGVVRGMEREYARSNLERYIPDFAAAFAKDPERVRPLIRDRSWRPLVHYLFEINSAHGE